ncbi:hypothetical protein M409DRAFT_26594 [Zasmidium cellare ATCC 36951]|uniref:Uncharacterized protein n=1 Tax=Zasmidium cellare ATCC 36951 TaxID=1080233 RepID=A0A6A6CBV6_ZASCE|nr:uncharacterized protein M409DRAFT_26594 [Zasmidium cellare ATCC 36951]KAF2163149.1 hypothetical protein M409DRAFT_26594 [Zasmidium cellare ATCC 36951]
MVSSLEILRPTPSLRTPTHRPTHSPSKTAHDLETRSIAISRALLLSDPTHPVLKTNLTPDFTSEEPNRSRTCVGIDVITVSANVDEERGRASVWVLFRESDLTSGGLSGENVSVLSWWRERGVWRCWRQTAVRGVSGFTQGFLN